MSKKFLDLSVSLQEGIKSDPDFIIFMPCGFRIEQTLQEVDLVRSKAGWNKIQAVKSGNVFVVDGNQYFNRPGPRLVDSVEILTEIFHQENLNQVIVESVLLSLVIIEDVM